MRHRIALLALMALAAGYAVDARAGGSQNMAGCGLGSMFIKDSSRGSQILAGTTNATGGQIYAITTGTSGCDSDPGFARRLETERFVSANFRSLSREMAAGQGEYAAAFASALGCGGQAVPAFLSFTKSRYGEIFPAGGTTPAGMLSAVESAIAKDPAMSQACSL